MKDDYTINQVTRQFWELVSEYGNKSRFAKAYGQARSISSATVEAQLSRWNRKGLPLPFYHFFDYLEFMGYTVEIKITRRFNDIK
jgi:hypothetical protein